MKGLFTLVQGRPPLLRSSQLHLEPFILPVLKLESIPEALTLVSQSQLFLIIIPHHQVEGAVLIRQSVNLSEELFSLRRPLAP